MSKTEKFLHENQKGKKKLQKSNNCSKLRGESGRVFSDWQSPLREWLGPVTEWQRPMAQWQKPLLEWYVPNDSRVTMNNLAVGPGESNATQQMSQSHYGQELEETMMM